MLPEPLPVPLAAHIDLTLPSSISLVDERRPARRVDGARALPDDEAFWAIHEEVARLGRGCFGSVLHVRDHASGRMAAAKVVASSAARDDDECPLREPELLSLANHQHVVQLLDVFQSPKTLFILQEVARTDLMSHVSSRPAGVLDEPETRGHLASLLSAVQHLHGLQIVHRDIKATNVLLTELGEVRLADFGLAVRLPENGLLSSVCGTHDYLAPEMIRCGHGEVEGYGTSVDLWGRSGCSCTRCWSVAIPSSVTPTSRRSRPSSPAASSSQAMPRSARTRDHSCTSSSSPTRSVG